MDNPRIPATAPSQAIRSVVDPVTRLCHAVMVLTFSGAWITSDFDRLRKVHSILGYTLLGAIAVRLLWGVVGVRSARLPLWWRKLNLLPQALVKLRAAFSASWIDGVLAGAQGPRAPLLSLTTALQGLTTAGLLLAALLVVGSGHVSLEIMGRWNAGSWLTHAVEEVHEALAHGLLVGVGVHLMLVGAVSWLRHQHQALTMVTGRVHKWRRWALRPPAEQ